MWCEATRSPDPPNRPKGVFEGAVEGAPPGPRPMGCRKSEQTQLVGAGGRLRPVGDLQLEVDVGRVALHRGDTDEALASDLLIGQPRRHQPHDVHLSGRKRAYRLTCASRFGPQRGGSGACRAQSACECTLRMPKRRLAEPLAQRSPVLEE